MTRAQTSEGHDRRDVSSEGIRCGGYVGLKPPSLLRRDAVGTSPRRPGRLWARLFSIQGVLPGWWSCPSRRRPDGGGLQRFVRVSPVCGLRPVVRCGLGRLYASSPFQTPSKTFCCLGGDPDRLIRRKSGPHTAYASRPPRLRLPRRSFEECPTVRDSDLSMPCDVFPACVPWNSEEPISLLLRRCLPGRLTRILKERKIAQL